MRGNFPTPVETVPALVASLGQQGPAASGESSPPASIQLLPPPSTRGAGDRHRDSTRDPSCRLRDNGGGDAHDGDQHVPHGGP